MVTTINHGFDTARRHFALLGNILPAHSVSIFPRTEPGRYGNSRMAWLKWKRLHHAKPTHVYAYYKYHEPGRREQHTSSLEWLHFSSALKSDFRRLRQFTYVFLLPLPPIPYRLRFTPIGRCDIILLSRLRFSRLHLLHPFMSAA